MTHRLLIGPANYAGQATAIAHALEAGETTGQSASLSKSRSAIEYDADLRLHRLRWALDPIWRKRWRNKVEDTYSHVLIDGGIPLTRGGLTRGPSGRLTLDRSGLPDDIRSLMIAGVRVGLLYHGSEIRDPDRHMDQESHSPFKTMDADLIEELRRTAKFTAQVAADAGCPTYVTTPDLLMDAPDATWLPTVVSPDQWAVAKGPRLSGRPRVLSAPSSAAFSGVASIENTLQELHVDGLIELVQATEVAPDRMPNLVKSADIVLDKVGMGLYGVLALEAMAAGRLVLGHANEQVRGVVKSILGDVPVVEMEPGNLSGLLRRITAEPEHFSAIAARGPAFVSALHSGAVTSEALLATMGSET